MIADVDGQEKTLLWTPKGSATQQSVTVSISPIRRKNETDETVGVFKEYDLEVYAVLADFTSSVPPNERDAVSIDSKRYLVMERETDAVGVRLMLGRRS
jgi:hypothetical protein